MAVTGGDKTIATLDGLTLLGVRELAKEALGIADYQKAGKK